MTILVNGKMIKRQTKSRSKNWFSKKHLNKKNFNTINLCSKIIQKD
jgi:hypothetical protein